MAVTITRAIAVTIGVAITLNNTTPEVWHCTVTNHGKDKNDDNDKEEDLTEEVTMTIMRDNYTLKI